MNKSLLPVVQSQVSKVCADFLYFDFVGKEMGSIDRYGKAFLA